MCGVANWDLAVIESIGLHGRITALLENNREIDVHPR
jgi:hypothetical protein